MRPMLLTAIFGLVFAELANADICPPQHSWVSPHPRQEYFRADGTLVSATYVVGHCRSTGYAYEFWEKQLVNGTIPSWPHKTETMKQWSRQDLEDTIRALDKLPKDLWSKVRIYRSVRSETLGNPASHAAGIVVLYDKAFADRALPVRYLAHELAHEKFRNFDRMDMTSYQQIAGWVLTKKSDGRMRLMLKRERRLEADSDLSPDEDFANNLEYFIFEPTKLKVKIPALYDWFALQFGEKMKLPGDAK